MTNMEWMMKHSAKFLLCGVLVATMLLAGCDDDDPDPTNEEEVITTLYVDLTPQGGGTSIELKFFDEDGDGSIDPVITPAVAQLEAGVTYEAEITLFNESETPTEDVTVEIEGEKEDHLFCFDASGADVTITPDDEDDNGLPIGLVSIWEAGDAGAAGTVTVTLRHQPGVKTGVCPGPGDSDIEVVFPVQVVD